jgi:hypothetical protein
VALSDGVVDNAGHEVDRCRAGHSSKPLAFVVALDSGMLPRLGRQIGVSLLKNLFDHRVRSSATATVGDARQFVRPRNPVTTVIVKIENHDLDRSAYARCPKQ